MDMLTDKLADALIMALDNMEEAANCFEDGNNAEAWEWVAAARLYTKEAIETYRAHQESAH